MALGREKHNTSEETSLLKKKDVFASERASILRENVSTSEETSLLQRKHLYFRKGASASLFQRNYLYFGENVSTLKETSLF